MPIGAIIGGAANLIGGAIGSSKASKDRRAAQEMQAKALQYLESVGVPSIEAQQILLENPDFVYNFSPEAENAINLGPSAMEDVSTDPRLAQAQMDALSSLQQMGETPLSATEQAALNQQRRDVSAQEQARQGALLQEMAARGAGGSGIELAARLGSSQAAAQRQGEESDRLMAMAQERALQSIAQAGALGGNIRGQEFGEKSAVAQAADEIARFNAANQQSVQQRNVGARNIAAQNQAQMQQDMENLRTTNLNRQQLYNKNLLQQQFQNQMDKARVASGALNTQAGNLQQQAANTAQNWTNIGSAVGNVAVQQQPKQIQPIDVVSTEEDDDRYKYMA